MNLKIMLSKNQPITNNYQESELIEITDTLKQAQNYVRGY